MVDCKDIKICSQELLKIIKAEKDIKPVDERKILLLFSEYIDRLIFNIGALSSLLCLKIGIKRVLKEHSNFLMHYLNKYCKTKTKSATKPSRKNSNSMKGGAFNTAQFFGVDESNRYKVQNEGTDLLKIDFDNNIARPEIGLMTGGQKCNKLNKIVKKKMKSVFAHFGVKIDNDSLEIIMNKFNDVLDDITDKIKKTKGSAVTYSNIKIILSKGKIMKK
jgi:hypothetical protein